MNKGWPKNGCKISNQSSFQPTLTAEELNGLYFHLTFLAYIGILLEFNGLLKFFS